MLVGTHEISWNIRDKELTRIKTLNHQKSQCGPFIHVGVLVFYLVVSPKGLYGGNHFEIYLHCCPGNELDILRMDLQFTCNINGTNYNKITTGIYNKFCQGIKICNNVKWSTLKHLDSISINISFSIVKIFNKKGEIILKELWNKYDDNKIIGNIYWKVEQNDISRMNKFKFKGKINSDIIYMGDIIPFCAQIYPKGFAIKNYVNIYLCPLKIHGLDVDKMEIWCHFKIKEIGYNFADVRTFEKFPGGWGIPNDYVKPNEILGLKELNIEVTFQILSIKNKNGNNLMKNILKRHICSKDIINEESKWIRNDNGVIDGLKNEIKILKQRLMDTQNENKDVLNKVKQLDMELKHTINNIDNIVQSKLDKMKNELMTDINELKKTTNNLDNKCNRLQVTIQKNDKVLIFLKSINMDKYYDLFMDEGFETMNDLKNISIDILKDIGITKAGHYSKIFNELKQYNTNNNNNNDINIIGVKRKNENINDIPESKKRKM